MYDLYSGVDSRSTQRTMTRIDTKLIQHQTKGSYLLSQVTYIRVKGTAHKLSTRFLAVAKL